MPCPIITYFFLKVSNKIFDSALNSVEKICKMAIGGRQTFISTQASITFNNREYIAMNKQYDLLCAQFSPFLETLIFVSGVHTSVPL